MRGFVFFRSGSSQNKQHPRSAALRAASKPSGCMPSPALPRNPQRPRPIPDRISAAAKERAQRQHVRRGCVRGPEFVVGQPIDHVAANRRTATGAPCLPPCPRIRLRGLVAASRGAVFRGPPDANLFGEQRSAPMTVATGLAMPRSMRRRARRDPVTHRTGHGLAHSVSVRYSTGRPSSTARPIPYCMPLLMPRSV